MDTDPMQEIEQEAEERREELDEPQVETAGDAAAQGLIGPDQPGGPPPAPEVDLDGGPPSPPGPAKADPSLAPQERDPSLVTPRMERDGTPGIDSGGGAIPASDLHPAERARLAHEPIGEVPERDRGRLRPPKSD
jgi:hypothetical protein